MLNYDKYLNDFNSRYFNRMLDNKDKLIRAFTIYYGEKYSYKINELINSTNYYCFIPSDFYKLLPIIRDKRYDEEVDITYQIISLLGIPKIKEINDGVLGDVFVKKGNLGIYLNKMSNVYNQNGELIDDILTAIFGDTNMFHYYYEIIPLYNFFNLSDEKQKEFVKKVFKSDTVSKK